MSFQTIDLSTIPAPQVVETLVYDNILNDMVAELQSYDSKYDAILPSDPAYEVLQVMAYREMVLRQRINNAAIAGMIAQSTGTDLDNLAANNNVVRLLISPGDPNAVPPVPPIYEDDNALRYRALLSWEALSSAGSIGAYLFHTLSADADVLGANVVGPTESAGAVTPGHVNVYILSHSTGSVPSSNLIEKVTAALSAEEVRPLTDFVTVLAPTSIPYTVTAILTIFKGPDPETVRQSAEKALLDYTATQFQIGRDITLSGIYGALQQPGVQDVELSDFSAKLVINFDQVAVLTAHSVTVGGIGE